MVPWNGLKARHLAQTSGFCWSGWLTNMTFTMSTFHALWILGLSCFIFCTFFHILHFYTLHFALFAFYFSLIFSRKPEKLGAKPAVCLLGLLLGCVDGLNRSDVTKCHCWGILAQTPCYQQFKSWCADIHLRAPAVIMPAERWCLNHASNATCTFGWTLEINSPLSGAGTVLLSFLSEKITLNLLCILKCSHRQLSSLA